VIAEARLERLFASVVRKDHRARERATTDAERVELSAHRRHETAASGRCSALRVSSRRRGLPAQRRSCRAARAGALGLGRGRRPVVTGRSRLGAPEFRRRRDAAADEVSPRGSDLTTGRRCSSRRCRCCSCRSASVPGSGPGNRCRCPCPRGRCCPQEESYNPRRRAAQSTRRRGKQQDSDSWKDLSWGSPRYEKKGALVEAGTSSSTVIDSTGERGSSLDDRRSGRFGVRSAATSRPRVLRRCPCAIFAPSSPLSSPPSRSRRSAVTRPPPRRRRPAPRSCRPRPPNRRRRYRRTGPTRSPSSSVERAAWS